MPESTIFQIPETVTPPELLKWEYYRRKIPLWLQESPGFIEHFKLMFEIFTGNDKNSGVEFSIDNMLYAINIFAPDYIKYLQSLPNYADNADVLDKIAKFFGVARQFSIPVKNGAETVITPVTLNDKELLLLIKAQIIKRYCDGSYEQIKAYYKSIGLYVAMITPTVDGNPDSAFKAGTCRVYLQLTDTLPGVDVEKIKNIFKAGLFRIEEYGILYEGDIIEIQSVLLWDTPDSLWDAEEWI